MLLVCSLGLTAEALADEFDTLNFDFGLVRQTDSNVFRLSAAAASDPQATVGRSSTSDTITTTSAGLRFSKSYSLQRLEAQVNFVDYKYSNFDFLSFAATNYGAAWKWSFTPRLFGVLSSERKESLNSFLDFRSFVRNIRTESNQLATAEYDIGGGWRALAGLSSSEMTNSQQILEVGDFRSISSEAGLRFVATSGSQLQFVARSTRGDNFRRSSPVLASLLDTKYQMQEYEVRAIWLVTAKSTINARLAHQERKHPNFSQRDFSGLIGGVDGTWGVSAKSRIQGGVSRDLSAFQFSNGTSYIRSDRLFLAPVWDVAAKVQARARFEELTRAFLGATGPVGEGRVETIRSTSIGLDWQPFRAVTLSASIQSDVRRGNQAGIDFKSNGATLSAQLTF